MLLRLLETRPPPSPLPRWYDASKLCDYHRALGHSTDNCLTLRDVIQDLIDNGTLVVSLQEAAHTPALAPAYPSVAGPSSSEPAGSEDAGTSGAYPNLL